MEYRWTQLMTGLNALAMRLLMGMLHLLGVLPYRIQQYLGKGLGWLLYRLGGRRKVITQKNLAACFPDLDEQQRHQLLSQSFIACGRGILEAALAWWAPDKRLNAMIEVEGLEHLKMALAEKRGVLIITPHLTTLEIAARILTMQHPCVVVQRQQKNKAFDSLVRRYRLKYIDDLLFHEDIKGMLRTLKDGKVMCMLPDQDMGRHKSVFAPFFGVPAATITGIARLAKLSKSPVVPGFCYYKEGRYVLSFSPALTNYPTGSAEQDAATMNAALEVGIRRQPEQYIWCHRRFKTRPEGAASIY